MACMEGFPCSMFRFFASAESRGGRYRTQSLLLGISDRSMDLDTKRLFGLLGADKS